MSAPAEFTLTMLATTDPPEPRAIAALADRKTDWPAATSTKARIVPARVAVAVSICAGCVNAKSFYLTGIGSVQFGSSPRMRGTRGPEANFTRAGRSTPAPARCAAASGSDLRQHGALVHGPGALRQVTADAADETIGLYDAAGARGATVVVPPTSTAHVSRHGPRSRARDRTILAVKERGRRGWKQTSGDHGPARVEHAFFRHKSIIGNSLRACSPAGRGTAVVLACNILNQMTGLGRPMSYRIGR